jgi:uncharacterized protein
MRRQCADYAPNAFNLDPSFQRYVPVLVWIRVLMSWSTKIILISLFSNSDNFLMSLNLAPVLETQFHLDLANGRSISYRPGQSSMRWADTNDPVSLETVSMQYQTGKFNPVVAFDSQNPAKKIRALKIVKITLGLQCNYSCTYCSQAVGRVQENARGRSPDEFVELLQSSADLPTDGAGLKFEFWGGEPLVYWKKLKPLAENLRRVYPHAQFNIITNGSLLDLEKAQWLVDLGFSVAISHDGPGYFHRGKDPLENQETLNVVRWLALRLGMQGKFSFNCVLTPQSYSLVEVYRYLAEKLGYSDFRLNTEGFVSVYNFGGQKVWEDPNHLSQYANRIAHDLLHVDDRGELFLTRVPAALMVLQSFLNGVSQGRPSSALPQKCGMDQESTISVDLDGNLATCQNVNGESRHRIGHLSTIENALMSEATHWSHFENCRNCAVLHLCRGSCMYLKGELRRSTCDSHFAFYAGLLKAGVKLLTGSELVAIHGSRVRLEGQTIFRFTESSQRSFVARAEVAHV